MLSLRAALLVCLLGTAAGMQMRETQAKEQSAKNELSEKSNPHELEQRMAEVQLEIDRLKAEANGERAQMQQDKESGNVANEASNALDEPDEEDEWLRELKRQKDQEANRAIIEKQAKAKKQKQEKDQEANRAIIEKQAKAKKQKQEKDQEANRAIIEKQAKAKKQKQEKDQEVNRAIIEKQAKATEQKQEKDQEAKAVIKEAKRWVNQHPAEASKMIDGLVKAKKKQEKDQEAKAVIKEAKRRIKKHPAEASKIIDELVKAKKKQEKDQAIVAEQAIAKDVYRAKKRARHSAKKVVAEKQKKNAAVEVANASKPAQRQPRGPIAPLQTSAVGDPHLVNMFGQRFDIARPGEHVLIQVPKQAPKEETLLRVLGTVETSGSSCADMYFTSINVTGHWSSRPEGYHFSARDFVVEDEMKWTRFGPLRLKVAHGHTHDGIKYLNFFVKNLEGVKLHVGGLMGEDDHTYAATPAKDCRRVLSLLQVQTNM